jgi:hypothetical protein
MIHFFNMHFPVHHYLDFPLRHSGPPPSFRSPSVIPAQAGIQALSLQIPPMLARHRAEPQPKTQTCRILKKLDPGPGSGPG